MNEGLIKLPEHVLYDMKHFVLSSYFSWILANYEHKVKKEDLPRAKLLIDAAMKDFGLYDIQAHVKTEYVKLFLIDETIYKTHLKFKIRLKVMFTKHNKIGRSFGTYFDSQNFIILSPHNMHMTRITSGAAVANSLAKLPAVLANLEHELTHVVQFKTLHSDQLKMHQGYENGTEQYLLSPLEFDPLIKSAVAVFKLLVRKYEKLLEFDYQKLLGAFLCTSPKPEWVIESRLSLFFHTLKYKSPSRWKKAIPLFITALNKS